jgi:hypothetical protein
MATSRWIWTLALGLVVVAAVMGQEPSGVSVDDDLPLGGPVEPGTIEPTPDAPELEEAPPTPEPEPAGPVTPTAEGEPDAASAPMAPAAEPEPSPEAPEMAYTGIEMIPWMAASALAVIVGAGLLIWSRRSLRHQ